MKGAVWKFPETKEYTNDHLQLNKLADIDTTPYGTDLKTIAYHPTDSEKAVSVVDNNFVLWNLANEGPQVFSSFVSGKSRQPELFHCYFILNSSLFLLYLKIPFGFCTTFAGCDIGYFSGQRSATVYER